jgi:DNA processing protein
VIKINQGHPEELIKLTDDRIYWLAWSSIAGVGPISLKRLYQHFGSVAVAWNAPDSAIAEVAGFGKKLMAAVKEGRSQIDPEALFAEHIEKNPHFWTPSDPEYPRFLWEIPSPPPLLYYQGKVNLAENQGSIPTIAIVGTRNPTDHGKRWARRLSTVLAQQGFTIVSGMAEGIDGEAHQSCLKAGGRTIAVLGTGVDVVYPSHHRQLYEAIQKQGLVISEHPAATQPNKAHFPSRNRIIAGLSRATIVIEAPERSGSLITARYANEFGGDIYALPNSPDIYAARGCLQLIRQGAEIIVSEEELLEMLGAIPSMNQSAPVNVSPSLPLEKSVLVNLTPQPDLEPRLAQVYQLLATEPVLFDFIVQKIPIPTSEVAGILLELELMGLVTQLPGMRYQRT